MYHARALALFTLLCPTLWCRADSLNLHAIDDQTGILQRDGVDYTLDWSTGRLTQFAQGSRVAVDATRKLVLVGHPTDAGLTLTLYRWHDGKMTLDAQGSVPLWGGYAVPTHQGDWPFALTLVPNMKAATRPIPFAVHLKLNAAQGQIFLTPVEGMSGVASLARSPTFSPAGQVAYSSLVDDPDRSLAGVTRTRLGDPGQFAGTMENMLIVTQDGHPRWAWETSMAGAIPYRYASDGRRLLAFLPADTKITHGLDVVIDTQTGQINPSGFIPQGVELLAADDSLTAVLASVNKAAPLPPEPNEPDRQLEDGDKITLQYEGPPGPSVQLLRKGHHPHLITTTATEGTPLAATYSHNLFHLTDGKTLWTITPQGDVSNLPLKP